MPNLRDIRRRIKAVKNTAQITRAMQLVAASKMKRAQDLALHGRPYAQLMAEMLLELDRQNCFAESETPLHPFLAARPVKRRGILLITPDKGLCGPLVSNILRLVADIPKDAASYVCVGRKGSQAISRSGRKLIADFSVSDKAQFHEIRPAVELMIKAFDDGEIDTIEVLFARFVNTLKQEAVIDQLVPITNLEADIKAIIGDNDYTAAAPIKGDTREFKFEPAPEIILGQLLNLFVKGEIHQMLLEAKASEHSARMVAMKTATDNAKELAANLTLDYNKARQAAITQEILEIAAAQFTSKAN